MGHEIVHLRFDENTKRNRILEECNEYSRRSGESISQIRFLEAPILDSYEQAEEYLRSQDSGWYDCLAVRYREATTPSKRMQVLDKRCDAAMRAYRLLAEKPITSMTTAKFIGCKNCGSKLSRDHLRGSYCPLCNSDLRSETHQKKIRAADEKVKYAQELLRKEKEKVAAKSEKVSWLVKIEYHT